MNRLLLNDYGRNHIKVMCLDKDFEISEDEAEQIAFAKGTFEHLQRCENLEVLYKVKKNRKGYLISVLTDGKYYYLIQSLRYPTDVIYVNTIYMTKEKENDFLALAKFLVENNESVMKMQKQQIVDTPKEYEKWLEENKEEKAIEA